MSLIIIISLGFFYFILSSILFYFRINYVEKYKLFKKEGVASLEILFLLLMYGFTYKTRFYRHQYYSLILLFIMGVFKYLIQLLLIEEIKLDNLLFILVLVLIFNLLESIFFFVGEKYMKHKYFSPYFISFIFGVIFTIIGIIMLIICLNIDFGENETYQVLFKKINFKIDFLLLYIIYCILIVILFFLQLQALYNFTIFHLFLYNSFFEFVSIIIKMILDYNHFRFILIIFSLIEMLQC